MALRTYEEYLESLRAMRPNIYKFDQLIEDVTTHPATRNTIRGHGQIYKMQSDPNDKDLFVIESHITGEPISRYLSLIRTSEDMFANSRMKRRMFQLTGTCTGG